MTTTREVFDSMSWGPAPESAGPALAWLDGHRRTFGHFIGGTMVEPVAGDRFATVNPATGQVLAQVAQGGPADVDRAVAAARAAQPGWWALGGHGRALHLYGIARGLQQQSRLFAVLESLDNGKPIRESRDVDIPLVVRHFYHHAGWAELMATELAGQRPVGVVGQIIPWNFPLLMLAWKIAPALAMGNTVVLKPAEYTPLTALLFAELASEIGLPAGIVNIVTGDGRTGQALVEHPGVDQIAFTGSTEVGRQIRIATAGTGKRLSLELGGKSPFIVFDDADLDSVVEGVVDAIWFNQGQVCWAGSRILAQEPIAESLAEKLKTRMETLRVGDPLDKAIDIGAIVAPVQLERIRSLVAEGQREGAVMWQPSWSCPTEGLFYPPTLFTDVAPAATIAQVEIFGPVVVMMSFRTPAEAVELANNTRYGLAASIWTENLNTALDIAPKVKAGTVWINCTNVFDAAAGFGGYGVWEYVVGTGNGELGTGRRNEAFVPPSPPVPSSPFPVPHRTYKLYIGGQQVRPDGGATYQAGSVPIPLGNRKDLRNAVEAARGAAVGWGNATAHLRAQVLYYFGENLALRADEFGAALGENGRREVDLAVERAFCYAAWADKFDGRIHATPFRNVTLAMREPLGVVGVVAPEGSGLLGFLSTVLPAVAMGNTVVAVPSESWPMPALDCCQIFDTSDLPGGVINLLTGRKSELVPVLAAHDDVDAVWCFGTALESKEVERLSVGNLKRTWVDHGVGRDWFASSAAGPEFLRAAVQVKNIWVPYGA